MQNAVAKTDSVPATIAILNGRITVGLSNEEIEYLGKRTGVRKCSRRDLAIAVALEEDAATTVAGTMIVAHMAGIAVFATGGIGGVHRGHPFDVSADLMELGRTPVAVICSGAKAILDLPLTLEVLETQGVPVIGLGTSTLPAFYTRSSGLPLDAQVDTAQEAARVIAAAHQLKLKQGVLVTVPVPMENELPEEIAQAVIQQAADEATEANIRGKEVTPFLLRRVVELTDGRAQAANTALLINNARVAAEIALALSTIQ
jgi:pseudouridine-5'-phosphate glycosidase